MTNSDGAGTAAARYDAIRARVTAAAGQPENLAGRAAAYLAAYRATGGTFSFALIAGHGAAWARWYLLTGRLAAMKLASLDITYRRPCADKRAQFERYLHALRVINRDVMIEACTICHYAVEVGPDQPGAPDLPRDIVAAIAGCAARARAGEAVPLPERRALYEAFFRWEQTNVVGPRLEAEFDRMDWPLMRALSLRPWVWFNYFPLGRSMNFRHFLDMEERVEKGIRAFEIAEAAGWPHVEARLDRALSPRWPMRGLFARAEARAGADAALVSRAPLPETPARRR